MYAVRFDNVSKTLGSTLALDRLSLEIPAGSTTAVLGASGGGKSTLLNMINGLLVPDIGRVDALGTAIDYSCLPELRLRIGYALQSGGLFPHLKVGANITLAARLCGWTSQRTTARLKVLLDLMRLPGELSERYPHELSGGQQQRAGICRAMMLEPELLLLDEPFSGVDPITRLRIHEEFGQLLEVEPVTTVIVTHDPAEALKLAGSIIVLEAGRVVASGPAHDVAELPQLAGLFGAFNR